MSVHHSGCLESELCEIREIVRDHLVGCMSKKLPHTFPTQFSMLFHMVPSVFAGSDRAGAPRVWLLRLGGERVPSVVHFYENPVPRHTFTLLRPTRQTFTQPPPYGHGGYRASHRLALSLKGRAPAREMNVYNVWGAPEASEVRLR